MKVNNRILIVDDNISIHKDFSKALVRKGDPDHEKHLENLEQSIFGDDARPSRAAFDDSPGYELEFAGKGEDGYQKVFEAHKRGDPFSVLFMDVRMPGGWDGVTTAAKILTDIPFTEIVLVSAYSDYSWEEIVKKLGVTDRLLFLTKPFNSMVVKQMAMALTKKWTLNHLARENEKALIRAKDLAEASSRGKSDFLANMSHEIRTPLNGVIGIANLLAQTKLDEEQRQFINTIRASADILLDVINDILDYSKIEAGKLEIELISFDLRTTIDNIVGLFVHRFEQEALSFKREFLPDAPLEVRGDPTRVRQILINLLSNAVKFTGEGGISLTVRNSPIDEHSVRTRFEVGDTGIGIPASRVKTLFQSFTQADASTTRKYGGSGLGLAICKRLVNLMGGRIGVESAVGKGSTFWFEIDFERSLGMDEGGPDMELKDRRLLFISLSDEERETVAHLPREWGCQAHFSDNVQDAFLKIETGFQSSKTFDAIVVGDLPMVSGQDDTFMAWVKHRPELENLKRLRIISVGATGDIHPPGYHAFVTTPIIPEMLKINLVSVLMHQTWRASNRIRETIRQDGCIHHDVRILLAEDNLVNQKVVTHMLRKIQLPCDIAANGKLALEQFKRNDYSLVLMDCHMPEMDGYQATREMRAFEGEGGPRTPIIALTANALKGEREKCIQAGMDDYLVKPIDQKLFLSAVQKWLFSSRQAKNEAHPDAEP